MELMSTYRQEEWRLVNPELAALQTTNDSQPENSVATSDPEDSQPENSSAPSDSEDSQAPHQDQAESDANLDDANTKSSSPPDQVISHDQPGEPVQSSLDREKDLWGYSPSVSEFKRYPQKPPRIRLPKLGIPNDDLRGIRPIPSVIDMEQDPYDGPWEPHDEPVYMMLFTHLSRKRARRLRDQIRHHGFWAFHGDWFLRKQRAIHIGPLGGLTFRHRTSQDITLSVAWGNREVVDELMEKERLRSVPTDGDRRRVLLVQRDGGAVRIDGLKCKCNATGGPSDLTFTTTLLDLFKDFEV